MVRRARAEEALLRVRDIADQANRGKSLFLASMSHEIRTPMNAILVFAQLLQRDTGLQDYHRDHLERILRSGGHLLQLIDDVLEMSRPEASRISVDISQLPLHSLVHDLEAMFRTRAAARRLSFEFHISPDVPRHVLADVRKIVQILINLLSNAIKFTDKGTVTLRLQAPTQGWLRFVVEDTNVGISEAEQALMFNPFEQSQRTRHRGGTGLGLAISQRFTELMGGTLVVDEEDNRRVVAEMLITAGFTVSSVDSARAALEWMSLHAPDVVLTDLRMSSAPPPDTDHPIDRAHLDTIPRTVREALLQATLLGDIEKLEPLIESLPEGIPIRSPRAHRQFPV